MKCALIGRLLKIRPIRAHFNPSKKVNTKKAVHTTKTNFAIIGLKLKFSFKAFFADRLVSR